MTSNIKRLNDEMVLLEKENERYISSDKYYVLDIRVEDNSCSSELSLALKQYTKVLLKLSTNQPLAIYLYKNMLSVIYSSQEENNEHYRQGIYSEIISLAVNDITTYLNKTLGSDDKVNFKVFCKIIEIATRTIMFGYFSWKIFQNSKDYIIDISNGKITKSDILNKTNTEIEDRLRELKITLNKNTSKDMYGVFYKLQKKKGKIVIVSLSESFDARDRKKYLNFIFNS